MVEVDSEENKRRVRAACADLEAGEEFRIEVNDEDGERDAVVAVSPPESISLCDD